MHGKPLVSTIIPTYKRAEMLPRAIESVLNQTYANIEVIIVDDNNPNSRDRKNVEEIMGNYKEISNVIYIQHEENKNGSAARNTGIKYANGMYICFLDDDNYFYPDKIEKQVKYLLSHPEYKAAYCGLRYHHKEIQPYRVGDLSYEQFLGNNIIDTNMIIMERTVAIEIGGWDERLKRNQDVSFILRYFKAGYRIGLVKEVLAYIDLADRSNVADPRKNEKNFDDFFKYYYDQINECENKIKNAKKNIYSFRYRGVLLNYLKNNDLKGALKLYIRMMKIAPFIFNKYLIAGFIKKIQGKPLYRIEN
ncbi:glycosyltransferase family A protein [Robertmurraya massiliosenegalensis]|uniref:glycosyltransferase family 2 protein n=1 Tax=Robertmurraya TaxID=2837507 RepID=UPI0039A4725A